MKYFTFDWWIRCQSCNNRQPFNEYSEHLASIRDRLTPELLRLEENGPEWLHDAALRQFRFDVTGQSLRIALDSCASGSPYTIVLIYSSVSKLELAGLRENALPGPAGLGDLGYWETDCVPGGFEHRFLFSSGIELQIVFEQLRLERPGAKDPRTPVQGVSLDDRPLKQPRRKPKRPAKPRSPRRVHG